jgi:hypothetical protein
MQEPKSNNIFHSSDFFFFFSLKNTSYSINFLQVLVNLIYFLSKGRKEYKNKTLSTTPFDFWKIEKTKKKHSHIFFGKRKYICRNGRLFW